MNKTEILQAIKDLSRSQGFYGRLLSRLQDEDFQEEAENFLDVLEEQEFKDVLDLVMFLET